MKAELGPAACGWKPPTTYNGPSVPDSMSPAQDQPQGARRSPHQPRGTPPSSPSPRPPRAAAPVRAPAPLLRWDALPPRPPGSDVAGPAPCPVSPEGKPPTVCWVVFTRAPNFENVSISSWASDKGDEAPSTTALGDSGREPALPNEDVSSESQRTHAQDPRSRGRRGWLQPAGRGGRVSQCPREDTSTLRPFAPRGEASSLGARF